ncbi:MAG: hypothetical protein IJN43_05545 [Ruminococcus sp.]|nr:hypothetical protein [Ruminococcus sp.]
MKKVLLTGIMSALMLSAGVCEPQCEAAVTDIVTPVVLNVDINKINFPDPVFRAYVSELDNNENGSLSLEERDYVERIFVDEKGIEDLSGIEYFTKIETLSCGKNKLRKLDVSKNTNLKHIYCYENQITSLDLSNNQSLTHLYCNDNRLSDLNLSYNSELAYLEVQNNQITSLKLPNSMLWIYCNDNKLEKLDVSNCEKLEYLHCENNELSCLNLGENESLYEVYCYNNKLKKLDVSKCTSLRHLYCFDNEISQIDINDDINTLLCHNNKLTYFDISKLDWNRRLYTLTLHENNLTSLDLQGFNFVDISWYSQSYNIFTINSKFDLSTLPGNFDVNKASDWSNATVKGNILTVNDINKPVTYKYSVNDYWQSLGEFTLNVESNIDITKQPTDVSAEIGKKFSTTVKATGNDLTYKWYYKDVDKTKFLYTKTFTGDTYETTMSEARDGRQIYCVITDKNGNSVQSDTVTLTSIVGN